MDPQLRELQILGQKSDIVEVIMRLAPGAEVPPRRVSVVTRFGDILTARIRRADIYRTWSDSQVASLKAPRLLEIERPVVVAGGEDAEVRRPQGLDGFGRGTVIGVIDYGFDVFSKSMLDKNGSRVLALWDQRSQPGRQTVHSPKPFGYGRVIWRNEINDALRHRQPYNALGYHPGESDRGGGSHGAHVSSVAAGSLRAGRNAGIAPHSNLVLVHLSSGSLGGLATLGDGLRILEAVDFILRVAGDAPTSVNLSVGRHSGFHTGLSLVEQGLDRAVEMRNGTAIVQSAGNYRASSTHSMGRLGPGERRDLGWIVGPGGRIGDELEVFYSDRDRFDVLLHPPGSSEAITASLGETRVLYDRTMNEIGRIYHRAFDPNSPDHHLAIFLRKNAPAGKWTVTLIGREISDGRFHAWIERDPGGRRDQTRFADRDVDETSTIGSIANTFLTISVGAADTRGPFTLPARFGSLGPTRDGRTKPDILAPGVGIVGVRSTPADSEQATDMSTVMSGASQAAPYVTGVAALCLEAAQGYLNAHDIRRVLIGTANEIAAPRTLNVPIPGIIDAESAVASARLIGARKRKDSREVFA